MDAQIAQTQRKRNFFLDSGHKYTFSKMSKTDESVSFWRCEKKNTCTARIHVKNNAVIKRLNEHTHESDPANVEVARLRTAIKQRAVDNQELPSQIISNIVSGASQAVLGRLPKNHVMARDINRVRNRENQAPSNPQTAIELVIPEAYAQYNGENFLLIDSIISEPTLGRILVFGRQSYEEWSHQINHLYIDGTFKICPSIFSQLFEILANRGNNLVVPVFYALLPDKRRETYERLFRFIKQIRPRMEPESIASDFELAEIQAVQNSWPNAAVHGCFFHLNQSMWRKVANSGHKTLYDNEPDFKLFCKMIVALAFVPIQDLSESFELLVEVFPEEFRNELQDIADWFEDYYLGRLQRRNHRRRPMFPPEIWNLHERVLAGADRTNNFAEAAHKRMQKELSMDRPTIWRFIDGLRAVQAIRDKEYEEFVRGDNQSQKRRKYREADNRILSIVEGGFGDDGERTIVEYLRGLAQNFSMDS